MAKKPRVKWYGKKAEKAATEAAIKALMTGGEAILTDAINEAPVETGTLRRSGTVTKGGLPNSSEIHDAAKPEKEGGQEKEHGAAFRDEELGREQAVYVSFNTVYARRQHEELEWEHPKGGKAKYLEDPFNRLKSKVRRLVDAAVKKALRAER